MYNKKQQQKIVWQAYDVLQAVYEKTEEARDLYGTLPYDVREAIQNKLIGMYGLGVMFHGIYDAATLSADQLREAFKTWGVFKEAAQ